MRRFLLAWALLLTGIVVLAQAQMPAGVRAVVLDKLPAGASGGGSVTFDTSSTISHSVTNTFNYSSGVTVSATASLVVAYTWTTNQLAFTSVVWDSGGTNQSMTQVGSTVNANSGQGSLAMWCKTSPATGTNLTLQVNTAAGGERIYAAISSWKGTNSVVGTACANFASNKTTGASNTDTTISTTVTSATGHAVTGLGLTNFQGDAVTMNGTTLSTDNGALPSVANNRQSGSASVTVTFNDTTQAANLAVAGIDISP